MKHALEGIGTGTRGLKRNSRDFVRFSGSSVDSVAAPCKAASILKFVTRRFELEPLPGVREKAGDLSAALQ